MTIHLSVLFLTKASAVPILKLFPTQSFSSNGFSVSTRRFGRNLRTSPDPGPTRFSKKSKVALPIKFRLELESKNHPGAVENSKTSGS